ncbi:molybdopterin-binding/glycosyltransferase family 2 protein [Azospirillum sp.]|uniref:molybdopterin-binding/glycosyltransferase family 2 protein n=1 Tax=Azospirillum sp. TaxID=34012 RepID=UPI002D5694D6|nr:molybdopterin-binding/glycosyltransferase family 2 protein [Azospirillum sp.]HYD65256.1 molybdopterin-binding/glycosyltransferase family 2 protein [Azospirillum sp.]
MHFGPIPVEEAEGAILAHSVRKSGLIFKKGRVLSAEDVAALKASDFTTVVVARLGLEDVSEDEAATRIAAAVQGSGVSAAAAFTGRVNLFAEAAGVLTLDAERIDRVNLLDESVTIATLPAFAPVAPGQMVATVKIIPFAAPRAVVGQVERLLSDGGPALAVSAYRPLRAGLIQTRFWGVKEAMLDKTVGVTRDRLAALGGTLEAELRCAHDEGELADTILALRPHGLDLLLIAGASAITDRRDVLPAAIERAGGAVEHFGMPVDPGNLLLLAHLGDTPVLGLPGCARSPKLNGFDWVLQRVAARVPVDRTDIMRMGVGGLLAEIPSRPLPRASVGEPPATAPRAPRIAALVLAAGRSTRMGGPNKLLADLDGRALVARTVDAALASRARPVIVVTGHQRDEVAAALAGRPVQFVHNPDFAEGLSTSLRAGLAAVPADADGALVCLGDMPEVSGAVIDRLIAAYNPVEGRAICVPVAGGKRGNPVLWDRGFFADMAAVAGDTGAKHLIGANPDQVAEVPVDDEAVLRDVDTPDAIAALKERQP